MQAIGQNPAAQQIMAALQAHVAEHLGFMYRKQIEERLGATLPAPNEEMPEEIELQLSRLVADASKQLTQIHQTQAAQQQAQQAAQDPLVQMQQQELAIKKADIDRKAVKDRADIELDEQKLELERQKLLVQASRPSGVK